MIIFHQNEPISIDSKPAFEAFAANFRIIHAAGGIVSNEHDEILLIYRLEKWDFPKGKVERGEQYAEAAVREVQEETGLQHIQLGTPLPSTFHTYELNGEPILKETHWYEMHASSQKLIPQTEEDITQALWVPRCNVADHLKSSYPSLEMLWQEIMAAGY